MRKIIPIVIILSCLAFGLAGFKIYEALGQTGDNANSDTNIEINNPEIDDLNRSIQSKKDSIDALKTKQAEFKRMIEQKQTERADLENQMAIFDNRIAALQASIDDVKLNIEKTVLEIKKIDVEIGLKEKEIQKAKEQISMALGLLYKEGDKSDLEVILLNDNLSTYIDQLKHLKDLNSGISDSLDNLKNIQKSLEQDKENANIKRSGMQKLQKDLEDKITELSDEKDAKQIVLDETKQSEGEFQTLLEKARKEQQNAAADIAGLEKQMREKLASGEKANKLNENTNGSLIWPVPKNTITAYFHDPDYPYRNVFEHPAIDIRAPQSSQVKAAASGYVARAKPGPDGSYAYVMLVHANGISTVYGHVSKIFVEEDQYVSQGQIIALSGGKPGTPGAGKMTTGSHLHFEVRLNGIPVNPLEYLQ